MDDARKAYELIFGIAGADGRRFRPEQPAGKAGNVVSAGAEGLREKQKEGV